MTTILALMALPAFAEDAAIVLGVERSSNLDRFRGATSVVQTKDDFEGAGYKVDALANQSADAMRSALLRFFVRTSDAERLVVVMSGRFVSDNKRTWLIAPEAVKPSLFDVEKSAISVESVLRVLAQVPGKSVLMLGYD
jgi:hypothetical protein